MSAKAWAAGADGSAGDDLADFGEAAMDMGVRGLRRARVMRMRVRRDCECECSGWGERALVRVTDSRSRGLVGAAVDEDIDLGGGEAAALDAMSCELGVEAEGAGDGFSFSRGTPASTAAPRNMSPLIPEKQSR